MMVMMKNPIILLSCILLLSSLAVMASEISNGPAQCCTGFQRQARLPMNIVASYKETDRRCARKAVLLMMKNGAKFCVNPSETWVQNIIRALQQYHTQKRTETIRSEVSNGPAQCCTGFWQERLPMNRVVSYKETDRRCARKAVLLTMTNGAKLCANPSEMWVQNIIRALQQYHTQKRTETIRSEVSNGPAQCCTGFQRQARLPMNRVVSYKETDRRCARKAVLLTMTNGAKLCANPSETWVKNIIGALQQYHTQKQNGHTQKKNDHTQKKNDHTQKQNDHTQKKNDHSQMHTETIRSEDAVLFCYFSS